MLNVSGLHVRIGAVEALRGLSLDVMRGQMVGLSGRNGAGKTTALRAVMGMARLASGRIVLDGVDLTKVAVHHRAALGIG